MTPLTIVLFVVIIVWLALNEIGEYYFLKEYHAAKERTSDSIERLHKRISIHRRIAEQEFETTRTWKNILRQRLYKQRTRVDSLEEAFGQHYEFLRISAEGLDLLATESGFELDVNEDTGVVALKKLPAKRSRKQGTNVRA